MKYLLKELSPKLKYIKSEIKEDIRYIYAEPLEEKCICPYCGSVSSKVHSHYTRTFQDLPIINKKTIIVLNNRKYFCNNPDCSHKTFAPKYDFLPFKGKRTLRLDEHIFNIALNCSTIAASKILKSEAASAGRSTVSRILKKTSNSNK